MNKLLILTLGTLGLQAGILDTSPITVFTKATPYSESKIGFELINKSKRPIWIALTNGDNTTNAVKVDPATKLERKGLRFLQVHHDSIRKTQKSQEPLILCVFTHLFFNTITVRSSEILFSSSIKEVKSSIICSIISSALTVKSMC